MEALTTHSKLQAEPDERLLAILDCINDAVFIHDAQSGAILSVNQRACELYGFGRDEFKTLSVASISANVPPYSAEEALQWIRKTATEGAQLFEWQARNRSGQIFWVEVNMRCTAILGEQRVVVTARDISRRKRAEIELRQSEERFQAVVGNARDPVYCLNLSAHTYDYLSPAVELVLGFSVEECMAGGLSFILSRMHPDDRLQRRELAGMLAGGRMDEHFPPVLEFRFLHKTQGYRWISESRSIVKDPAGNAVAVIGNLRDITARREQEAVLQQAHAALLSHLENTTMALVECDARLRVRRWSYQAEKIFGWTADEVSGQHLFGWGLVHPDDLPIVERAINRLLDRSEPRNRCVNRNIGHDGRVIVCEWHNSAIVNDLGEIQSILSLATDVTLERKLEEALRAMGQDMATSSGEAFFQSLCLHLARILEASHAQVAMLIPEPDRRVQTLGYCAGGRFRENFIYPLAGTPGYEVSGGEVRYYDRDVQIQFPEDLLLREADATSYMGIPLRSSDGRVMGVMAAFSNGMMDTRDRLQAIFQIFAARAAAEMERLQTERALRKSEERYALAASGSAGGVWDWDIASGGMYYSPRFKELLGYADDEFPHSFYAWEQIVHPDDLQRMHEALERHLTRRVPFRVDYRIKSKSGEYRWFETCGQALWDKNGDPCRMAGSNLDIHERKQAVEALTEKERMIFTLLSNLPGGAAYRAGNAPDWSLEFVSQGCHSVTGFEPATFVGKPFAQFRRLLHPEDAAMVQKHVKQALDRRKPFEITYRIATANGQEKWIWERGQGIWAEDGSVQFLEGFLTDVTDKRRMESQILRAQRMESIGTLAGGIAHDLNNVLTPILMSLSLLRTRLTQQRDLDLLSTLEASANRGADMVRQIIGFARGVEGRTVVLSPKDVIKEIEPLILETFPKSIQFRVQCPPDIASIEGDPTQLHQVLLNLCVNARDAMPDGGRLDIRVRNVSVDDLPSIASPDARCGPYVMFEVTDTGAGIPPALIDRIFDPFFTTKEVGKGTGLGLSTTLGIVRSHHGFTELSSQQGKGTSFYVYIPAAPAGAMPAAQAAPPVLKFGKGELVMVVDDEESILTATTQTLEAFGYRVLTARHGADALAKYQTVADKPAIVVTDLMMPVMDGPALIEALLAIQPTLPFIAASGLSNHLSAKAMSLGVKHFLLKPYNFEELLQLLSELLQSAVRKDSKSSQAAPVDAMEPVSPMSASVIFP